MTPTATCQPKHSPQARRPRAVSLALSILMALLLFALLSSNAQARPAKMVMIGDSYSTVAPWRDVTYPWPERTRDALGLDEASCTIYRRSGYGFAKPQKHFVDLLEGVRPDPSVTDVLIVGGAGNDRSCSDEQICTWYRLTIMRLRTLYPNATIMHTVTSWDVNNRVYRMQMVTNIPIYQALARQCGVTYLYGCENTIRNHPEYFSSDGRHPTDRGQEAMSAVLIEMIRRYNRRYIM